MTASLYLEVIVGSKVKSVYYKPLVFIANPKSVVLRRSATIYRGDSQAKQAFHAEIFTARLRSRHDKSWRYGGDNANRKRYKDIHMTLRTLICKRDLLNGSICLKSVLSASQEKIKLVIHEDGSLDERDIEFLLSEIPQIEIVRRRESEELIKDKLQKHPKCLAYRDQHPLSNKLLDIPLLNEGTLNFIDSDILFFRKIVRIFPENSGPIFSKEDDQGYSGPLLKLISKSKNRLPSGCNTGLFRLPQTSYDLDYIEWFLGQDDLWQTAPALKEQTCFALLFGHEGCQIFSPSNLRCTHKKAVVTEATVAIHFIAGLKEKISALADQSNKSIQSNPITTFKYLNARKLTVASAIQLNAASAIKREIKRTIKERH